MGITDEKVDILDFPEVIEQLVKCVIWVWSNHVHMFHQQLYTSSNSIIIIVVVIIITIIIFVIIIVAVIIIIDSISIISSSQMANA